MNKQELELVETLKNKCMNLDLQYWDIYVSFEKGHVLFTCPPPNYLLHSEIYRDKQYFRRCQLTVRDCLPTTYRLMPQNEPLLNQRNDIIVLIESTESKALRASHTTSHNNEIPLMKNSAWKIDKEYHALISGVTGSGKTMLMMYLINQFEQLGGTIAIIDPKESDLLMYGKRQKLKFCVGNDYPTIIELLEKILAQMKTRQHVINELGDDIGDTAYTLGMTPLLLVIDELAALTASLTDNKQKIAFFSLLKQLMFMGRSAGITLIIGLQKPMAEYLPTSIRDQLALRIVLGKKTTKSIRRLVFDSTEESTLLVNDDITDEWQEDLVPTFGGWYQLPTMVEDFSIFESPIMLEPKKASAT